MRNAGIDYAAADAWRGPGDLRIKHLSGAICDY